MNENVEEGTVELDPEKKAEIERNKLFKSKLKAFQEELEEVHKKYGAVSIMSCHFREYKKEGVLQFGCTDLEQYGLCKVLEASF